MQAKLIVFPNDNGFSVLVWDISASGPMRIRRFDNRASMTAVLRSLALITHEEAANLDGFGFLDACPMYSAEIDEDTLADHGFERAAG